MKNEKCIILFTNKNFNTYFTIPHSIFTTKLFYLIFRNKYFNIRKNLTKGTVPLHVIFHENQKKLRLTTKEKILLDAESAQLLENHNITIQCSL